MPPPSQPRSFCTYTKRNSYSLCFRLEKRVGISVSTSHVDTSKTYFQLKTQSWRIIWIRCILLSLGSKTRRWATPLLPTWIYYCRSGGTVSCALPYLKLSVPEYQYSIPASLWRFISKLIRYARACSFYECLFWGRCDCHRSSSGRDMSKNIWNRLFGSSLSTWGSDKKYAVSLSQMLHEIQGLDHIQLYYPLIRHFTYSWPFYRTGSHYRLWPYYKISGCFH